jgi:glycosyltransferase involved in cell wall biosynthesis
VAGDFAAKGGHTVVAAMAAVRRARPDAHLVIAGRDVPFPDQVLADAGATRVGYLPRRQLLREFLPACAVFAYPSRFDGLPLTVLEAMATGIPCAVSDYFALPEVVADGGRSVPQDDPASLARALVDMLEPAANRVVGDAARTRYRTTYAPDVARPQLRENYEMALQASSAPRGRDGRRLRH